MSSVVPLGDCGERRIRSSETPLRPHGTSDSIATTVPFHAALLQRPEFARAEIHTRWVEDRLGTAVQ